MLKVLRFALPVSLMLLTLVSPAQTGPAHLINDVELRNADGTFNAVVAAPAGTIEKWQADPASGQLRREEDGADIVRFLPFPANYGFIPQTSQAGELEDDPLGVMVLAPAMKPGSVVPVKVLGALKFQEAGRENDKLIAVPLEGPFALVSDLEQLKTAYPGALEIVKTWLESYQQPGRMVFQGYANREEALQLIQRLNASWLNFDLSYEAGD